MVSIIGRRAPEFDKLRSLKDELREVNIQKEYNKNLWDMMPKSDPRHNSSMSKYYNLSQVASIINSQIKWEIEGLAERGIYKGAIRA